METPFGIPSDLPVDPVPEGDVIDSPVTREENESDESSDGHGKEIPE